MPLPSPAARSTPTTCRKTGTVGRRPIDKNRRPHPSSPTGIPNQAPCPAGRKLIRPDPGAQPGRPQPVSGGRYVAVDGVHGVRPTPIQQNQTMEQRPRPLRPKPATTKRFVTSVVLEDPVPARALAANPASRSAKRACSESRRPRHTRQAKAPVTDRPDTTSVRTPIPTCRHRPNASPFPNVGAAGFEPTTSSSQSWRSTRLSYAPHAILANGPRKFRQAARRSKPHFTPPPQKPAPPNRKTQSPSADNTPRNRNPPHKAVPPAAAEPPQTTLHTSDTSPLPNPSSPPPCQDRPTPRKKTKVYR